MGGYFRAGARMLVNLQAGYCAGSNTDTHIAHNIHPICHLGPGGGMKQRFLLLNPLCCSHRAALSSLQTPFLRFCLLSNEKLDHYIWSNLPVKTDKHSL